MNAMTSDQKSCERVVKTELYRDILADLDTLSADSLNEVGKDVVQLQLWTLHNVVRNAETARPAFRKYGAVDVMQKFRTVVKLRVFIRTCFIM